MAILACLYVGIRTNLRGYSSLGILDARDVVKLNGN